MQSYIFTKTPLCTHVNKKKPKYTSINVLAKNKSLRIKYRLPYILLLCDQLIYSNLLRACVKLLLRNYYDYRFPDHISLGPPKETHCLKPMRYLVAYLVYTYYHQLATYNRFIGIYDHLRVSPLGHSH